MRPRGATFCGPSPSGHLDPCVSQDSCGSRSPSDEPSKITMRTRVAVRDKNPHRFQVVPLRDAGKLQGSRRQGDLGRPLKVPSSPISHLLRSPSGALSPCSPTSPLRASLSAHSLSQKTAGNSHEFNELYAIRGTTAFGPGPKSLAASSSFLSSIVSHDVSTASEIGLSRNRSRSGERSGERSLDFSARHPKAVAMAQAGTSCRHNGSGNSDCDGRTPMRPIGTRLPCGRTHTKSTSLSNLRALHKATGELAAKKLTALDSLPSNNGSTTPKKNTHRLENHWVSSPETPLVKKTLSKKRHAIYTASLVLPDFEKLIYPGGDSAYRHASASLAVEEQSALCLPLQSNSGRSPHTPSRKCKRPSVATPQDTSDFAFEISTEAKMKLFSQSSNDSLCNPRDTSVPLCSSLSLSAHPKPASLRARLVSNSGNTIYPQVILELFSQIDQEIEDWSRLLIVR